MASDAAKERAAAGCARVAQAEEVMAEDAEGRVARLYEDIQATLRVPFVNTVFRVFATEPDFFFPAWQLIRPWLRSRGFDLAADRLRERAASSEPATTAPVEADAEAMAFHDAIHDVLPKLLLVTTAFEGLLCRQRAPVAADGPATPDGVARGTARLELVDSDEAEPRVRELLERIADRHRHAQPASYYRGLATRPALLRELWDQLAPEVGTPEYERRCELLADAAEAEVAAVEVDVPAVGEHGPELAELASFFRLRMIPPIMLDVAAAQVTLTPQE